MKAVVLAGGKGLRLRPYTSVLPKPLMPVGDRPILDIILRQLHQHGVQEVVVALGYLGSLIQAFLDQSEISKLLKIRYHWEEQPLGTAGAIGSIEGLDAPFFVMNGDILTSLDFSEMRRTHESARADLTVGVVRTTVQIELGVLTMEKTGKITRYDEKPKMAYAASMGIYVYSPGARARIRPGVYLDAPNLVMEMIRDGAKVIGFDPDCHWIDLGNSGQHECANQAFAANPSLYLPDQKVESSGCGAG